MPASPDASPRYADIDRLQLTRAVKSLPKAAAPGPSGWTRELVLPLLDIGECRLVLNAMLLGALNNSLPVDLSNALTACDVILLTKESKDSTPAGRPIAMGEVFCKIAAKVCLSRIEIRLLEIFGDLQFGALRKQGVEIVIHNSRALFRDDRGVCCLQSM